MAGVNIKNSEALEVLSMKIQCDCRFSNWCINVYLETSRSLTGEDEVALGYLAVKRNIVIHRSIVAI